jgi:hypothetical protein
MFLLCCTINDPPVRQKALVLHLLMPAAIDGPGHCRLTDGKTLEWTDWFMRGGRHFVEKHHARKTIRRMIRSGQAVGARLYLGGSLLEEYHRDPVSGREVRLPVTRLEK